MSYESESILREGTKEKDVINFVKLLGYQYVSSWDGQELGQIKDFYWFDDKDYRSTSGVELSTYIHNQKLYVTTRSVVSRSFYDLEHQNKTIRQLKKHFGGNFRTDEGKGRYLQPQFGPLEPAAAGCARAFSSFGNNLIRVRQYFDNRTFKGEQKTSNHLFLDRFNPRLISNILILPFIISVLDDYWKSTYVALLKYSENKEAIFKTGRIYPDKLVQISKGDLSVEKAFADSMSFARISVVCTQFKTLDKQLDFTAVLKKPYRRRKKNLFDSLEEITEIRNTIIHEASNPIILDDDYIKDSINMLHDSIDRCYDHLTKQKGWAYEKTWGGDG
jgi:hypothetical protein